MQASKQIARALIALMVLTTAVSALVPPAAAQNPVPVISISLSPPERTAKITASQQAAVSFTGNYTVDKLSFERAQVTFDAVVSTGWIATVSPGTVTITNQRTGPMSVTVVVPAGTSATEVGELTVTGRVIAGGLQSQAVETKIVSVEAYFRTIVSSTTPFVETAYSSQVVIAYRIYNEGNVRDQVKVNIRNLDTLSEAQWVIVMSRQSFTIEPTQWVDIQVTVGVPKAWQFISDNKVTVIELVASSGEGGAQGEPFEDVLPVFIRTVGFSAPGFDLPLVLLGAIVAALIAGAARQGPRRRMVVK